MDRPNIVEIIWPGLGDWLGCYGRTDVASPALDRIAAQGAVLEAHFSSAPLSSPSRASLKTGRYPGSHGILGPARRGWHYRAGLRDAAELLREAGYHTALAGIQDEREDPYELTYAELLSPDRTGGQEPAPEDVVAQATAFFGRKRPDGQPFYLSIGFPAVRGSPGQADPDLAENLAVPGFLPEEAPVRSDLAAFYQRVGLADEATGAVLQALDDAALAGDTFVYITTDNGPDLPRAGLTLYDAGLKVAFLCRWPGVIPEGRRLVRMSSHVDVLPTLLEIAGAPALPSGEGGSFLRRLRGERGETRDAIFAQVTWQAGEYDPARCVRTERFKYIRNYQPGWPAQVSLATVDRYGEAFLVEHFARERPEVELYDLLEDPWELRDLAGRDQYGDYTAELSDRLADWMLAVNDPLLKGPVTHPDPRRTRSGAVWVKAPPHAPDRESYRWDILRREDS